MASYPEHEVLDDAIGEAMRMGEDGLKDGVVVGWAVCVAYRTPEMMEQGGQKTGYAWFTTDGQPQYATIGLIDVIREALLDTEEG